MPDDGLRTSESCGARALTAGGISGALAALRSHGKAGRIVVVGHDLMEVTRHALLDGLMTLVLAHPLDRLGRAAIDGMVGACLSRVEGGNWTKVVPFDLFTRENM